MKLTNRGAGVFVMESAISYVSERELAILREAATNAPRRRARINLHLDNADPVHEMIIAIARGSYIRPHRHPGKSESFHLIEGAVDVVVFDDDGAIMQVIALETRHRHAPLFYRMSRPFFHTIIVRSAMLIVHEVTNGPFEPDAADHALFAPQEDDVFGVTAYMSELLKKVDARGQRTS
jgi:cupin fold WbuC family metalloprotein